MAVVIVYMQDSFIHIVNVNPAIDASTIDLGLDPEIVTYILGTQDLPEDFAYRSSWYIDDGTVLIDIVNARNIHKTILEEEASLLIVPVQLLLQQATSSVKDTSTIMDRMNYLRNIVILKTDDIENATNITELKAVQIDDWSVPDIDDLDPAPVDQRLLVQNIINVKKNPGLNEYSSVKSAVDSISDSSESNRYLIKIGPGIYSEEPMEVPCYTSLLGSSSIIQAVTSGPLFTMTCYSEVSFIDLEVSSELENTTAFLIPDGPVTVHKLIIKSFQTGISVTSSGSFFGEYLDLSGSYENGIINNGICQVENFYADISESVSCTVILSEGPSSKMQIHGTGFKGATGHTAIIAKDGTYINLGSSYFENYNRNELEVGSAIISENLYALDEFDELVPIESAGPKLQVSGTTFLNCNYNFNIKNVETTGHFVGYSLKNKYKIVQGSQFFIGNEDSNIITVAKRGANFDSVKDALDYITDATIDNMYTVVIGSGIYEEDQMTVPDYVSVMGTTINTTTIKCKTANQHLFVLSTHCELSFMSLMGHDDTEAESGYAGIYCLNIDNFGQLHKLTLYHFDIGIYFKASTIDSYLYVEYVDMNECLSYDILNISENNFISNIQLENYYSYYSESATKICILNDGTNAVLKLNATGFMGPNQYGIYFKNGGTCDMGATFFQNITNAIKTLNEGSGPILQITSTSFDNCTVNFSIENPSTTGYFFGHSLKTAYYIVTGSTFFIANQDAKIVRVAKRGGDFTSIKSAINSITDSSFSNPYAVSIGPGIYFESEIQMKTGIFMYGVINGSVIIMPPNPAHTIIYGAEWSMIKDLILSGAASGTAIYHTGTSGDGFLVRDCAFTSNQTNVHLHSSTALSVCVVDRCITSGNVTYAYTCTSSNEQIARLTLQNLMYQDLVVPVCDYFASVSGPYSYLIAMNCMLNIVDTQTAKGFIVADGAQLRMSGVSMRGFGKAIHVPTGGLGPSLYASSTLIHDSVDYDILVEHADTTGVYQGATNYNKTSIHDDAPFNVYLKDQHIITVGKKGSDFNNITEALTAITDASTNKRYIIKVGPGIFTENVLDMKPFVHLEGSGLSTKIMPVTSSHIVNGSTFSGIKNCLLAGATEGYAAVYFEPTTATVQNVFTVQSVMFGLNHTHVILNGSTTYTNMYVNDCWCGSINAFNTGFHVYNSDNNRTMLFINKFHVQELTEPYPGDLVEIHGPGTYLYVNGLSAIVSSGASSTLLNAYDGTSVMLNSVSSKNFEGGISVNSSYIAAVSVICDSLDLATNCSGFVDGYFDTINNESDVIINRLGSGPISEVGTASFIGTSNNYAREDHVHEHGSLTGSTLHNVVTSESNGFMSSADKIKLDSIVDYYVIDPTTISFTTTSTSVILIDNIVPGTYSILFSASGFASSGLHNYILNKVSSEENEDILDTHAHVHSNLYTSICISNIHTFAYTSTLTVSASTLVDSGTSGSFSLSLRGLL